MSHLWTLQTPVDREFDCKCCGTHVHVTERSDKRMCFCSSGCERRYWRHRDRYERRKNISSGHVTDRSRDRWMLKKEA